jgi:hypothetical protein
MANPTYQSGFYAPGRGTAKYPSFGMVALVLGIPGGFESSGLDGQNNGVLTNGPTWGVSDGRQALL